MIPALRPPALVAPVPHRRPSARWLVFVAGLLALGGCAGYQVGNWSLYPSDIHTVYVPMFEAAGFRHNLAEWLTEAVAKEIENRTPYKVVATPNADSVLSGRIISETQSIVIRNKYNDPREVQLQMVVEVQWVDRRANQLVHDAVPLPPELAQVQGTGLLVPEVGQSVATAEQEAILKTARRIVDMMESPW